MLTLKETRNKDFCTELTDGTQINNINNTLAFFY
jgi:hypothetical protein